MAYFYITIENDGAKYCYKVDISFIVDALVSRISARRKVPRILVASKRLVSSKAATTKCKDAFVAFLCRYFITILSSTTLNY